MLAAATLRVWGLLRAPGIEPFKEKRFSLADCTSIRRPVGAALFEVAGKIGATPMIFGEPGVAWLLGALCSRASGSCSIR